MRMRYWLAALIAGILLTTRPVESKQTLILWDRTPPQATALAGGTLAVTIERGGDSNPGPLFYGTPTEGKTPDGRPGLLPMGLLAPGDTIHRTLVIRNTGTLDALITAASAALTDGSQRLANKLQVVVTTDAAGAQPLVWGPLSEFIKGPQFLAAGAIELKQGAALTLHVWVTLPLDTDNEYQGLRSVISFGIHAEQRRNNTPPPPPVKPPQLG